MNNWPKVAIIVLNWNGWRDTIECLESLQRITYPNYQIIVVDNGSTDDSVERIKEKFPHLTLIEMGRNLGYAGGNNLGIKFALEWDPGYICILNNDVVVESQFLEPIIIAMESNSRIGITGGTLYNDPQFTIVQNTGQYINFYTGKVFTQSGLRPA